MSSFLVNLARRGAGLPATTIQAPPPLPFKPEIRKRGDELTEAHGAAHPFRFTEEPATGNTAGPSPAPTSSSEEYGELPLEAPLHHAASIQRFYGTELDRPIQPAVEKSPATLGTPSLGPTSAPRQHVILDRREAHATPMDPPKFLNPAAPPFHSDREVITEIEIEHGHPTTRSAAQTNEPVGEPAPRVISVAPGLPIIIREPSERQVVLPAELSAERPRDGTQKRREPALPAATIRPALAESHTVVDFPRVHSHPSLTPSAQLPIHVRIGRVEVRATTAPTPTPARPSQPSPVGFASYYRVRNYRSWA